MKPSVSLVFEEDVEDVGLVLEALRFLQQQSQGSVVDGSAGVSWDAALRCDRHLGTLADRKGPSGLEIGLYRYTE